MSLLLSGHDMFDIDTDRHLDNVAAGSHFSDSCEDRNEMKELNVSDGHSRSQNKHKDVAGEEELTVDSITDGRLADVTRNSDRTMTPSTDAVGRSHHEQSDSSDDSPDVNMHRQHGVHSFHYALHIDIASHIRIEQTEDNADVIRTLREQAAVLINRYIPTVKHWLEVNICQPLLFCF